MQCCCAACSCINACCPNPRGGKSKRGYRDAGAPPPPPSNLGYHHTPAPYYSTPSAPQFATFDASKKVNADALPPMPSWDTATSKKVLDENHSEEMEMDKIDQHDEAKPMLAHSASPNLSNTPYRQNEAVGYSDNMGQAYGQNGSQGQAVTAAGGLGSRHQTAPYSQGYQSSPLQQRPGMNPAQDSYGSSATSNPNYGEQQRQNFDAVAAGYNHQNKGIPNQNTGNSGYTQPRVPVPNSQIYSGNQSPNYNQATAYGVTQASHGSEYSVAPSYTSAPNPPQAIYNGQQEYTTRPLAQIPQSFAPGSRSNTNITTLQQQQQQQPYQAYPGSQRQEQNQWRDV